MVVVASADTAASVLAEAEPVSTTALPPVPAALTVVMAVLAATFPDVLDVVPAELALPSADPLEELLAEEVESVKVVVPLTTVSEPLPLNVA